MTPLVTLQVFIGSALVFMQNVQPEKFLPLNNSAPPDFCDGEVWQPVKMSGNKNSGVAVRKILAMDFMRARIEAFSAQVKFADLFKNGLRGNRVQAFVRIFP